MKTTGVKSKIIPYFCRKIEINRSMKEKKGCVFGISDWKDLKGQSFRTDGCILLFCEEGMAVVSVEFKLRAIRKKDIVLIFSDTMFVVNDVSKLFKVRYIEVPSGLFDEATFTLSSSFFDMQYDNPVFSATIKQWNLLEIWEKQFWWIMQCQAQKSAYMMLRNHLQNFFIGLESIVVSEGARGHVQPISSTRQLFNHFCRLLVEHCYAQHEVKFYAEKLCITPYYLSKITGKTMGVSPKELIDRQIIMEMKRLLTTTSISIKDLAVQFHFDTMSYMARFFRRHTGVTPAEFREQ